MEKTLEQTLEAGLNSHDIRSRRRLEILFVAEAEGGKQECALAPDMIPIYLRERGHRIHSFYLKNAFSQDATAWSMARSLISRVGRIWRLGKMLRLERYDLVLAEGARALAACRCAMMGAQAWRPALVCHLTAPGGWPRNAIAQWALRSRRVSRVIVSSQTVRRQLIDHGLALERVSVVAAGIDASLYRPANTYETARAAIDVAPEAPLVCAIGEPARSPEAFAAFFEAFARVRDRMDGVKAVLVSAVDKRELATHLEPLGLLRDVICVEPGATTRHFLSASDVAVCLTDEGEGQTLARVMACVRPAIAFESADPMEWIRHGENGFIVHNNNSCALAAAIVWMLRNPVLAEEIALAGRRRIEQTCSQEACALQFEKIFLGALRTV
ncbi:MAG: glycosyltransferase family 4 protein [Candidatus Sumerlaeota bacterium]|nr:glycosyltransferase family 4 protein [Candidatus Sumerlaeota bacterium]